MIFVFGSNLSGIHGAGAAKYAYDNYQAEWGVGEGLTGNSYALPTKGYNISFMSLCEIKEHIREFVKFAWGNPDKTFLLTPVGTGLAGFSKKDIWKILEEFGLPSNVVLASTWVTD